MDPEAILATVTRDNAAEVLASLSEADRTEFEWWFVARYGDRLPPNQERIWIGGTPPEADLRSALSAMHRAILATREPI